MPLYDFTDVATGEPVELVFSMSDEDLPGFGEVIERDGRLLRREFSRMGGVSMGPTFPFTVHSQSKNAKGIRHRDSAGAAVMTSVEDVRHYAKANNLSYDWGIRGAR